jgi:hypothetical protein
VGKYLPREKAEIKLDEGVGGEGRRVELWKSGKEDQEKA